jgi:ubiquinone/menaquinone biosynthesis C-methylase UbiE
MSETDYWNNLWAKQSQVFANNFAIRAYKIVKAKNYSALLDVGCGDGRDSIYFSSKGLKVTAADFSTVAINRLRIQHPDIHWVLEDIRKMEFKEKSFDVVYSHLSLQYFDDETTNQIIGNIYKILANNGLLLIKCKSTDDQLYGQGERVGEDMFWKEHLRHFFSKEYMAKILHQFQIIRIRKNTSIYHEKKSSFIEAIATK